MSEETDPRSEVERLRAAIDALDDQILELVVKRMDVAQGMAQAKGASTPVRPAREVAILRRLFARAPLGTDQDAIFDVWRGLIAANIRKQGSLDIWVGGVGDTLRLFDLARRQYSAVTRIHRAEDPRAAVMRAVEADRVLAVAPFPGSSGPGAWWPILAETKLHNVSIIAALPMKKDSDDEPEAAVLTRGAVLEPAGDDATLAIGFDPHHRFERFLAEAELQGALIARVRTLVLVRFETFIPPDDTRIRALGRAGLDGARVVGSYARV
jgi:chorismate mutase